VVLGHIFPIFLGFRGGKGVATSCGLFIGLAAKPMEVTMIVWTIVTAVSRYVSLGTLSGALIFPFLVKIWPSDTKSPDNVLLIFSILCSFLIFVTHIPNIRRILNGEELRIGERPE
ncbi:MAG: glycerol-3-phosphate acyltransferase, partial [Candidatus Wallbacteria bacterium]|nr:glycerol-3-phosphate acyltransferase [Candidatus Wallbacteria bacterium]